MWPFHAVHHAVHRLYAINTVMGVKGQVMGVMREVARGKGVKGEGERVGVRIINSMRLRNGDQYEVECGDKC